MRLAVGITTILASSPPETSTKRSRMRRSFSLFSAPPIGMIQPRVAPSGILLGIKHSASSAPVSKVLRHRRPRERYLKTHHDRSRAGCRARRRSGLIGVNQPPRSEPGQHLVQARIRDGEAAFASTEDAEVPNAVLAHIPGAVHDD